MNRSKLLILPLAALLVGACGAGDGGEDPATVIDIEDRGDYSPDIDPSAFVGVIDNPFFPLTPGSRWAYESADGSETIEVVVLEETREVMGIAATVVRDTVKEDGVVIEDTYDWFAQDAEGNVWYLGEETVEYVDGEPDNTGGSWEAGVDGALPGIIMPANPEAGFAYRQEYYPGEAEDLAEVVELGASATVPFGSYDGLLVIREWNPLEPETVELKYYSPGIGAVLEEKVMGGDERVELVAFTPGP